jgi:hypothetical protein
MSNPFSEKVGKSVTPRGPKLKKKIPSAEAPRSRLKIRRSTTSLNSSIVGSETPARDNPWSLAARGTKPSPKPSSQTKRATDASSPSRVATVGKRRVVSGKRRSDTSMLRTGQRVKVTWKIDPAYGGGNGEFTGIIRSIDDRIKIVNSNGVIFYTSLSTLTSIERV